MRSTSDMKSSVASARLARRHRSLDQIGQHRLPRIATVPALTGLPLCVAGIVVVGFITPGYNPVRWSVSTLVLAGTAESIAMTGLFVLLGLSVAMAGTLLGAGEPAGRRAALFLVLAGMGLLAVAAVSRGAGPGLRTDAHRLVAAAALLLFALAPALAGYGLRSSPHARAVGTASWVATGLSAAVLVAGGVPFLLGVPIGGLVERAFVGVDLAWLEGILIWLTFGNRAP